MLDFDVATTMEAFIIPDAEQPASAVDLSAASLTAIRDASLFNGVFPSSVVANSPTGVNVSLAAATVGASPTLDIEVDQNYGFVVAIPIATSQAGKSLKLSVYNLLSFATALWSLDDYNLTADEAGTTITAVADDTNTGTSGSFYYELVNVTDDLLLCSGNLTIKPRGDTH
jgi:hypothetical protein